METRYIELQSTLRLIAETSMSELNASETSLDQFRRARGELAADDFVPAYPRERTSPPLQPDSAVLISVEAPVDDEPPETLSPHPHSGHRRSDDPSLIAD
jgi:hypothetical protein